MTPDTGNLSLSPPPSGDGAGPRGRGVMAAAPSGDALRAPTPGHDGRGAAGHQTTTLLPALSGEVLRLALQHIGTCTSDQTGGSRATLVGQQLAPFYTRALVSFINIQRVMLLI